jgi:signal peptidase II
MTDSYHGMRYECIMSRRHRIFAVVALLSLAADQLTKAWARSALVGGRSVPFIGGFWEWELSYNRGIAFGLFRGTGGATIFLAALAIAACVAILVILQRQATAGAWMASALGLVFAGALGNLIDRLHSGQVTDFILWRAGTFKWQNFNVADASLVVGVVILFFAGGTGAKKAKG